MLVKIAVSSMNTSRPGSSLRWTTPPAPAYGRHVWAILLGRVQVFILD
jgi:hypothetical protein